MNSKRQSPKTKNTKNKTTKNSRRTCTRWTQRENELLLEAIKKYGERNWSAIAQHVGTKNGDQCNQHWHRVLDPKICKTPWTDEEDDKLVSRVRQYGESAWKRIAEGLPGRTDIQCRHRWMMRKKYISKEKLKEKTRNSSKNSTSPVTETPQSTNLNATSDSNSLTNYQDAYVSYCNFNGFDDLYTTGPLRESFFSEPDQIEFEEETIEITKTSNRMREMGNDLLMNVEANEFEWISQQEPGFTGETSATFTDDLMIQALQQWHFFLTTNDERSEIDSIADSIESLEDESLRVDCEADKRGAEVALGPLCNSPKKRRRVVLT